jgi:hypothetical protein
MASLTKSSMASLSQKSSFDSFEDVNDLPSMLTHNEAMNLAQDMYLSLQPHIKDRTYRFKSYKSCFKHSHALSWAVENIDKDKRIAVKRLNELIRWGFVSHVVDPTKRFRVKEPRILYYRINQNALHEQQRCENGERRITNGTVKNDKQLPSAKGSKPKLSSSRSEAVQTKLDGLDHVLEQTVRDLNAANGRLELMHHKVCTLLSHQMSLFGVLSLLSIYSISQLTPGHIFNNNGSNQVFATFLLIALGKCGMTLVNSWSMLDSTLITPIEVIDGESISDNKVPTEVVRTYRGRPSFARLVSERFEAVVKTKSSKGLTTAKETSIVLARGSYSLPDVECWPHRPLLICVNTPVSLSLKVPHYGLGPCPLGKPFKFSSDLFEGTCLIRIKDSNSDDIKCDSEYFAGRKRIFQSVVQGRFKEDGLLVSDVLTGHEFARPLKNLPHPWILKTASNFIGRVALGSKVVMHTDQPLVEAILAGTSQAVRGGELQKFFNASNAMLPVLLNHQHFVIKMNKFRRTWQRAKHTNA